MQANEATGVQRTLVRSGQVSMDAQGRPMPPEDMHAPKAPAMDNVETILKDGGVELSEVARRLHYYTTDMDRFFEAHDVLTAPLAESGRYAPRPDASAFSELTVEVEGTTMAA